MVPSLDNCRDAIDLMAKTQQGVKKPGSNIASRALRVFKVNWKEEEIKTLRPQIQSHTGVLQLALQMITMVSM